MLNASFPTSQDIYIELNGKRLAVVESYNATSTCDTHYVESFGEIKPIATIRGKIKHLIKLSRVYACENSPSSSINFYSLSNFTLVIIKNNKKIIYSGCEWSSISEGTSLNNVAIENVSIVATKRTEVFL